MGEEWIRLEPRRGGDTGIMVGKDKRELGTEKDFTGCHTDALN